MNNRYNKKWFQFDLARFRSFNREETEELLKVLNRCGYNGIGLYIEGFFEFPEFGGAPREGCMTKEDAKWVCETAKKYDLLVMPMTNLVGHGESFFCQERFTYLGRDDFQFDMKHKDFRAFAKSVIDQFIDCFNPEILHIGGDEVSLDEEDRKDYVKFLSDMCEYLKEKGIQTGIWGDMFLKHPEMAKNMNKDVYIFDWWYYGHRYESTEMLINCGFKNIVICPATQSWDGIVGTQQMCPWKELLPWKCEEDVAADEVEAFLTDAQKHGVYDAMLTDWENYRGHLIWNNMHSVARFGRYVNGESLEDKALNTAIFSRETPYMECMHILMDAQKQHYREYQKLPGKLVKHQHGTDGIFNPLALCKLLQCGDLLSESLTEKFEEAEKKVKKLLEGWKVESKLEDRCKRHLYFAADYAKATAVTLRLANETKALYKETSYEQYKNPEKYSQMLHKVQEDFKSFAEGYDEWITSLSNAISDSGHTRKDIKELKNVKSLTEKLVVCLDDYDIDGGQYNKKLALPGWKELLSSTFGKVNVKD
ncbi:MAG: family 20 glycosylhydrolase [Clostridia bacterium]|nr:family 20 glycosylhydrolase [Clostridia bacterium]